IREGPRRDAKNCNVNVFIHEGPRRATKGREELQLQHLYPRRDAKNCNVNVFIYEGPRRATKGREELQLQLQHINPRRAAKRR
ncbi:MAG: hypothetical protein OXC27_16245, partial [Caldilineaceae bacterium]|nr:hypothetical protein [Caldilineaceae bacterium]